MDLAFIVEITICMHVYNYTWDETNRQMSKISYFLFFVFFIISAVKNPYQW